MSLDQTEISHRNPCQWYAYRKKDQNRLFQVELQRTRADIFIIFYRGHLDVHRSSVEDPRASIKEKQHKHAKNVAGALKKRRTGKGNVKKLVNFPGKHFRSSIFLHLNGILMHLQLHLQCTTEIIF